MLTSQAEHHLKGQTYFPAASGLELYNFLPDKLQGDWSWLGFTPLGGFNIYWPEISEGILKKLDGSNLINSEISK